VHWHELWSVMNLRCLKFGPIFGDTTSTYFEIDSEDRDACGDDNAELDSRYQRCRWFVSAWLQQRFAA
jgi:hypothetical protein